MSSWPGQTGRPKSHQARGVSAVLPCLAPSRLQIRLRMRNSTGGSASDHHGADGPACDDLRRRSHTPSAAHVISGYVPRAVSSDLLKTAMGACGGSCMYETIAA